MPESGELVLRGEALLDERRDAIHAADLVEHLHRSVRGSAMQRTLERAERGGHGGVHIGERRRGDPCRER